MQRAGLCERGYDESNGDVIMKHFLYVLFFILGGAVGVYWGQHHPAAAAALGKDEDRQLLRADIAASKAKIEVLNKFADNGKVDVKPMIAAEQAKLDDLNQKMLSAATQP